MSTLLAELSLPRLSTDQPPLFLDALTCGQWLDGLSSAPPRQQQALLLRQMTLLNRYSLSAEVRFGIMERLREPVYTVHGACAGRFVARPLPLVPPEQAAFDTCQALWQALETGYLHSLHHWIHQAGKTPDEDDLRPIALAGARVLASMYAASQDAHRAAIQPPPGFWQRLHTVYRTLEALNLTYLIADDPHHPERTTSGVMLYVETLLLAAAHPLTLDPGQIDQVIRWAGCWSNKVTLLPAPPADPRTPPWGVDLAGDEAGGFSHQPTARDHVRWLDMTGLRIILKQQLAALEKTPHTTDAAMDCAPSSSNDGLLRQVYQDWCRGGRRSMVPGRPRICQVVLGIEAIHYFFSGMVFQETGSRLPVDEAVARATEAAEIAHYHIESWQELDENVTDILLQRPLSQPGKRLARSQLVAVRTSGNDSLQIGIVSWVAISRCRDVLIAGFHILPGTPEAITLRIEEGIPSGRVQRYRGFLLPAIEGMNEPASILVPAEHARNHPASERMELITEYGIRIVRLTGWLETGVDFDRRTFQEA